jgi:histidinol-phosphatase
VTKPIEFGPQWSASLRRGPEAELRGWVDAALAWCVETDAIAMRHFRRTSPARKPDRTFVTEADTSIEQRLREKINGRFPQHGIVGEELGDEAPKDKALTRWYIDPIDGTHNYMRGVPIFGTLIAVERDGELQAAVISAPALRTRWGAWRGGGAWSFSTVGGAEPRRIAVSRIDDLAEGQVLSTSAGEIEASGRAPGIRRLLASAWRERGFGDFWSYTLVAEGAAEAMVEVGLKSWDAAAPFLLIEEAGGRATDITGERTIHGGTFVATNGLLHDRVLSILAERDEPRGSEMDR